MRLSEIDMGKYVMGKYIRRIIVYIPANDYSLPKACTNALQTTLDTDVNTST